MVKKQILIFLSMIFSVGCGSGGGLEFDPLSQDPVNAIDVVKKNGQDKITVDTSRPGQIRYLGEIENNGKQKYCFISISFVTRDVNNTIIDQGIKRVPLIGTTLSLGGTEYNDCLLPGEFGSFDSGYKPIMGTFDHYEFRICENPNNSNVPIGCSTVPTATTPHVHLEAIPTNLNPGQDADDKRVFNGVIKNSEPDGSGLNAYNISIVFTILDLQGNVIDTTLDPTTLKEQPIETQITCTINGSNFNHCLRPQDGFNIQITTNTLAGDTCDILGSCYYYRIHHSE